MTVKLSDSQQNALKHVNNLAKGDRIDTDLRVTIHFHPDRSSDSGHILELLIKDRVYKSQFETNTSNGGLTAHPGGDRWMWESRIFGKAYDNEPSKERPKYGSLDYKQDGYGGSPRFGSTFLRLKPEVLHRSTFCYPDSYFEPEAFGTSEHIDLVSIAKTDNKDPLDDYIETQVHGEVRVPEHIEAIVLDPSYKDSEVKTLSRELKIPIEWHRGYVLSIEELEKHIDYRGKEYVELGKEISIKGIITPKIIGDAAITEKYDPQALKKVWHYLARFGRQ